MNEFTYSANEIRALFGSGTRKQLSDEIAFLGACRAMVITSSNSRETIKQIIVELGDLCVTHFNGAEMHTPIDVTQKALSLAKEHKIDCLVAIGGGSATGLAKAIALRTDLPQIILPTTYAGSELTPIIGETENGLKSTQSSEKVLAETVIYDTDLTVSLPVMQSVTSAINAMAHAVEALYAEHENPIISAHAEQAIITFYNTLPKICVNPQDITARTDALYACFLSGLCLGSVGMALHHKLCHSLGGGFGLPHAATHCVVLPHVIQFNAHVRPELNQLGNRLHSSSLGFAIFELIRACNGPTSLQEIGMKETDLDTAASLAMSNRYYNPRSATYDDIRELLQNAYSGIAPDASLI